MQLRPAGNFKRWTKGREILCSKGNSNGKNEVSWHPRARGWFHIYLQLKQAQWLPICVVSALRLHPGLGCLWGPLCPLYSRGWRWTGISPGGQQTWESQSCPFSHGWGEAVWSGASPVPSCKALPTTGPVAWNCPGSCSGLRGDAIKLTFVQV